MVLTTDHGSVSLALISLALNPNGQMVLKLPQGHEDSEYVLSFKIGQRGDGFYSAQTDGHTEPPMQYGILI